MTIAALSQARVFGFIIVVHGLVASAVHSSVIRFDSSRLASSISSNGQVLPDRPNHMIPEQLLLTGKEASLQSVSGPVRKNIQNTIALNPELNVRWLSDESCRVYLVKNFDREWVDIYDGEARGSYRGDICRTAFLSKEGGFYTDLDVEWKVPMHELVENTTTFMSVTDGKSSLLNAVIAATPDSAVMKATLTELRDWYRAKQKNMRSEIQVWMGPATLRKGLEDVMNNACPEAIQNIMFDTPCGPHNFRLYEQRRLHCEPPYTEECPQGRSISSFDGLQWGLYEPGRNGRLVAWPRFAGCRHWGCGGGGWTLKKLARRVDIPTVQTLPA